MVFAIKLLFIFCFAWPENELLKPSVLLFETLLVKLTRLSSKPRSRNGVFF